MSTVYTHKNYVQAALYASAGFGGWTVSDAFLKLAGTSGVSPGQVMLVSGISGMVVVFLLALLRGNVRRLKPHRWQSLLGIGLCQWVAFVCWVTALPHLPLANMYAVSFLTPMTVATMAALILKEHLGWKRATAITCAFIGVVVAVNPANLMQDTNACLPYIAVFGSMMGTSTQMFLLRAVGKTESNEAAAFYPRMVIVAVGAASCLAAGFAPMGAWMFLALCASGALGGLGWALMAKAYKNAPAAAVAPFQYCQMLGGALLGYLIWGDVPTRALLCGAAIIIVSGIYLVRHERRASRTMVRVE